MNLEDFIPSLNGHLGYYGNKIRKNPFYPKSNKEINDFLDDFIKSYSDAKVLKDELKGYLEENYAQVMEEDMTLKAKSKDRDHIDWLNEDKKVWKKRVYTNSQFGFYKNNFQIKHGPLIANDLDASTDAILSDLENPTRQGRWETKGMVVGDVQSGKTANYAGLIAKAIDSGYKLIIVMSGIYNSLRSQTQERLMENLIGTSHSFGENVFKVNFMTQKPTFIKRDGIDVMTTNGDFNARTAHTVALLPNLDPTIFVIKKHVDVLSNILIWLNKQTGVERDKKTKWEWKNYRDLVRDSLPEYKLSCDLPFLLIDDECDSASIDISKRQQSNKLSGLTDEEIENFRQSDPSKTNQLIRRILASFNRNAYIGYTATPLANIFIDYTSLKKSEGRDLFPRDFIKILKRYDKYQSPLSIFGKAERNFQDDNEVVSLSEDIDSEQHPQVSWIYDYRDDHDERDKQERDDIFKEENAPRAEVPTGWMAFRHKQDNPCLYKEEDQLPPSLKEAIKIFFIISVLRKIRKNKIRHNSMLVHVSRFVKVQEKVQLQISNYIKNNIRNVIQNEIDESRVNILKNEFKNVWEKDVLKSIDTDKNPNKEDVSFEKIWSGIKSLVIDEKNFEAVIINSNSTDNLSYEKYPDGWNVIVIGGAAIARGITLEGLSVSYFLRVAQTPISDTLIQMGRWFGYREGYEDIFKIYCPKLLHVLFRQFTYAMEFARDKFAEMQGGGGEESKTPIDYAMEIPSFQGWKLISAAKAKDMVEFHEPLFSYSSKHHQNIVYFRRQEDVDFNIEIANKLLESVKDNKVEDSKIINDRFKSSGFWTPGTVKVKIDHEQEADQILGQIPKINVSNVNNVKLWRDIDLSNILEFLAKYKQPRKAHSDSFAPDIAFRLNEIHKQKKDIKWNLALWSIQGNEASKTIDFTNFKKVKLMGRGTLSKFEKDYFSLKILTETRAEFMDLDKVTFDEGVKSWVNIYKKTGKTQNRKNNRLPSGFLEKIRQKRKEGLFILYPFHLIGEYSEDKNVHMGWEIIIPSTRKEGDGEGELIYKVALNRVAYEHRIQNIKEFYNID